MWRSFSLLPCMPYTCWLAWVYLPLWDRVIYHTCAPTPTRSPTLIPFTFDPTAVTVPAISCPTRLFLAVSFILCWWMEYQWSGTLCSPSLPWEYVYSHLQYIISNSSLTRKRRSYTSLPQTPQCEIFSSTSFSSNFLVWNGFTSNLSHVSFEDTV